MARVTLTKSELESKTGKEFIEFVEDIGRDGSIDINEISTLLSALQEGGRFNDLVGAAFLRETIMEIISDGNIEQFEVERLRYAISRMLPKRIRDESDFYSKDKITESRLRKPAWHDDPASDKQIDLLLKFEISFHPGINKGDASSLISDYIQKKESRPSPRQLMVLRFFDRMDLIDKTKAEITDWMDQWYSVDPKRKEAWENYKSDNGGDIIDPENVEIGIGLAYLGGNRPSSRVAVTAVTDLHPEVKLLPHLRPKPTPPPKSLLHSILSLFGKGK